MPGYFKNADFVALDKYKTLETSYNRIIQKRNEIERKCKAEASKKSPSFRGCLELSKPESKQTMNKIIDEIYNELNGTNDVFDEAKTKKALEPVTVEFLNGPDDLESILAEIEVETDFDNFETILDRLGIEDKYPATAGFLNDIYEYVLPEYYYDCIEDLHIEISRRLEHAYNQSKYIKEPLNYLPMAYNSKLTSTNDDYENDGLSVKILNGQQYSYFDVDECELTSIYDICDMLYVIDTIGNYELQSTDYLDPETRQYYRALCYHVENGEPLDDVEMTILKRKIDEDIDKAKKNE